MHMSKEAYEHVKRGLCICQKRPTTFIGVNIVNAVRRLEELLVALHLRLCLVYQALVPPRLALCLYMYVCMCVCVYVWMCGCVCVCVCVCV